MNVFVGSHLPVRTSAGPTFAKVSGKSMITQPSGLPDAICCGLGVVARLLRVVDHLLADRAALGLPGFGERVGQAGAVGVVAGADVDRLALAPPRLLSIAPASVGPWNGRAATSG